MGRETTTPRHSRAIIGRNPSHHRRRPILPVRKAELHAHTTFSDGTLRPEQLVDEAVRAGLAALAITDHDIVEGVAPARAAAAAHDLEIVPGVEFSSNFEEREMHILGLFIDDENAQLVASTHRSRAFRRERAGDIVERLNDLGVAVDLCDVEAASSRGAIGRPHIAQAIVEHGATRTVDEAFHRFIGVGRPAFVPKPTLHAAEVIAVVHSAGGVAILAHPASSRVHPDQIRALAELGLDGFEIQHPKHSSSTRKKLSRLIDDTGLLPSGGSDFHGPGAGRTKLGEHAVSLAWMEALRAAARQRREQQS
ncbi:MAG: PHP domain-containing protein [Acidobacteriota bacterium]